MPKQNIEILTFNRGIIDKRALSRIDIDRVRSSAEIMTNYLPSIMGAMSVRQGTKYTNISTKSNNSVQVIPFVYSLTDNALIELSSNLMRVIVNDVLLTRPSVSTTISNGGFTSSLSGWTDASTGGASVTHSSQGARFLGTSLGGRAILKQTLTVSNTGTEHGFRIYIPTGKITILMGSSDGNDDLYPRQELGEGYHSLSITPNGNIFLQFESSYNYYTYVRSIAIESGVVDIITPFSSSNLGQVQSAQSFDVVYTACQGNIQPRQIIRRTSRSWSIEKYMPEDGPFLTQNITSTTMTLSAFSGDITITSSDDVFYQEHVGSLIKISPPGQEVTETATAEDVFTDSIEVEGIGNGRDFTMDIAGTFSAEIRLQRSFDDGVSWQDTGVGYTAPVNTIYNDTLDNVTALYRLGIKTGLYTSGSIDMTLTYSRGRTDGIFCITGFTNSKTVSAKTIQPTKSITATDVWKLGAFSERQGYPTAVALHEGRLFLATDKRIYGSISDAFKSFDEDVSGASAYIERLVNNGPIYWLCSLGRLIIGTLGGQEELRSSSFDEPLTQDDSTIKIIGTDYTSNVPPIIIDKGGLFISNQKVFELRYNNETFGYTPEDLLKLARNLGDGGFVNIAVSRNPETKVHCVRSDGKVIVLSYDPTENLRGWSIYETDGIIENVAVLPDITTNQDQIYYVIRRTINGSTARYYEKWSLESECVGGTLNKNLDAHITGSGETTTITGLSHLENKTVYVWADGKDLGSFIVSSGQINVGQSVTNYVVGLGYASQYKTVKLPYAAGLGAGLTQNKSIQTIGFNLVDSHIGGFTFGSNFNDMDNLPLMYKYEAQTEDKVFSEYDDIMDAFPSINDSDARLCIQGIENRPHTITAIILGIQTNDKG